MRVLLLSTYDLGRQPFGLASPAAWLRRAGAEVVCIDTSRDPLDDAAILTADVIAVHLPMHTATRLAGPLIERVRAVNPRATLAAYGLYAPLNRQWLEARGVQHVIGPEAEPVLAHIVSTGGVAGEPRASGSGEAAQRPASLPRVAFIPPDRTGLPALSRYAALQMPDGTRLVAGSTEATRGCRHLCRHCPIVPVYQGVFRAVPIDVVIEDVRAQVAAGARHITFGDPDFFNGPTHARRLVERFATEFPGVSYDVTIKVEHLLAHGGLLPLLRETGCLFVTSAVESLDDEVLRRLAKGHTRADVAEAVARCRAAGLALAPTFVPFTPWTSLEGYADLIEQIAALDLVEAVAPVQLAIRLLVTAESALLTLPDLAAHLEPFDAASLTWPWRHVDARVDQLQTRIRTIVAAGANQPRRELFAAVASVAFAAAGRAGDPLPAVSAGAARVPVLTENWYCCAEPVDGM